MKTISNQLPVNETRTSERQRRRRSGRFIARTLLSLGRKMDRALSAEEIARADGLLQRLDPRVKVIGLLALLIDVALARNLFAILGIFAIALSLAFLSHAPVRTLVTRAWLGAFLFTGLIALPAIFITPGNIIYRLPLLNWHVTAQGLHTGLYLIARVETAVTLSLLLILCTLWTQVLKALWVMGVPVVFIVILGMTYRYIFLMIQSARDMFESRQSRMVGRLAGHERRRLAAASVGVLLTKSFYLSSEVYLAMQSRGFRGEVETLDNFQMRGSDWLALILFLSLAVFAFWLGRQSFADSLITI